MAHHQIGEELSPGDVKAIVSWLGSLTGELPASYIAEPKLPE
jgi:cytochrome c peroxidase